MWRGGCRPNISVSASFVWRCLSGSALTPFPHPAHRTGHADLPHPALGQDFTPLLSRATPSAVSEHSAELIGCPISRSFTTYCVCLELRSLPSTGVTRLQRYYEPLRHPKAPGLSLTGFRLVLTDHALGLPVLRTLSLCTCCRHYPGAALGVLFAHSPSRISLPRKGRRVGLRIVLFEACSAFTRVAACTLAPSPIRDALLRRLQPLRYLHSCSGCFRLERLPGGTCTHWKAPPCHGAHPKPTRSGAASRPLRQPNCYRILAVNPTPLFNRSRRKSRYESTTVAQYGPHWVLGIVGARRSLPTLTDHG